MSAIQFMRAHCPVLFIVAQKLGVVGQGLFDAGRVFERFTSKHETFGDGSGI